jgi:hypothetical protein
MRDRYSPRNMMIFDGDHSMPMAEVARRLNESPRWMDRPSGPGMWVCVDDDKRFPDVAINLTQEQIDSGAPFASKRVYGPIPEDEKQ